jgi:4-amino-4-deoxy-L-arabinose transferase-like glycosyltransferase
MEAAGALGRGSLSTLSEAVRERLRARSRAFWIVAGLTALAAALRFATLGVQAYHHDEIVTASRVLRDGFWHAMDAVGFSESAPPLYYVLAWAWTQVTGTGEVGLRSLSALAGVATVPVAYLLGGELAGRRAGILAAALVAVNPMLLWYSQEARGYALLVLLTALAALYFVRALDRGRRADIRLWGAVSALALATHYFAVFPIALEALWLLRRRGRAAVAGLWIVAAAGLLLAPLAIHQMSLGHAEWIGDRGLLDRLWEAPVAFAVGETGDIIAQPDRPLPALVPLLSIAAALALLALRGNRGERRGGGRMLAIGAATIAVPIAVALLIPGKDYFFARNLLPALVPLLVAVAIAMTLREARRAGAVLAAVLVAYSLGFCVLTSLSPRFQRPAWDSVAARLGEPDAPRAIVSWTLGHAALRYYLSTGSFQVLPAEGFAWFVHEVDFVSNGPAPPVPSRLLGPRFRQVGYERVGALRLRRYSLPGPDVARLRLRAVRGAQLGFGSNGILLDGIGPRDLPRAP